MASRATLRDLNALGTGSSTYQLDHRCIGLVLLRRTRNAELHPVAVHTDHRCFGRIGNDQHIDFNATSGCSYRAVLHHERR